MHATARRRFTADEVDRMVASGILAEDERVELLDGELVVVSPQGPMHAETVSLLLGLLVGAYQPGAHVRSQLPIDAGPEGRPEPDLAVVRGRVRDYHGRHPAGADTLLAVEVAWTSHDVDREKAAIYARAAVPVHWLLDVRARRLEVHTEPDPAGRYRVVTLLAEEKSATAPGLDVAWPIADLLP